MALGPDKFKAAQLASDAEAVQRLLLSCWILWSERARKQPCPTCKVRLHCLGQWHQRQRHAHHQIMALQGLKRKACGRHSMHKPIKHPCIAAVPVAFLLSAHQLDLRSWH